MDKPLPISMIVAVAENQVIGRDGKLPWYIPSDLKRFKKITMGSPIIMGRKTFESIGKPLKGRKNIVLSRNNTKRKDVFFAQTPQEALDLACQDQLEGKEIFIIGGKEIYHIFLPFCQKIYLTQVHGKPEGNIFFPSLNEEEWKLISQEYHPKGPRDDYDCSFLIYQRIHPCPKTEF